MSSLHMISPLCILQVATYRAFTVWRETDKLSDKDKKEAMFQQTFMIQELCEKGQPAEAAPRGQGSDGQGLPEV